MEKRYMFIGKIIIMERYLTTEVDLEPFLVIIESELGLLVYQLSHTLCINKDRKCESSTVKF